MNYTMDAEERCQFLLNLIRKSNLNYLVEETSFSASIKIKKSFIKNKDGSLRTGQQQFQEGLSSNIPNHSFPSYLQNNQSSRQQGSLNTKLKNTPSNPTERGLDSFPSCLQKNFTSKSSRQQGSLNNNPKYTPSNPTERGPDPFPSNHQINSTNQPSRQQGSLNTKLKYTPSNPTDRMLDSLPSYPQHNSNNKSRRQQGSLITNLKYTPINPTITSSNKVLATSEENHSAISKPENFSHLIPPVKSTINNNFSGSKKFEADLLNFSSKIISNIPSNPNLRLTVSPMESLLSTSVSEPNALINNFSEPFTNPPNRKVSDDANFEAADEEFPNVNPEEQAILRAISRIINGSLLKH
jgi:hypothetical protein